MIATMNSHHNANVATEATRPTRTRSAPAIVHAATNIAPIEATGITSDSGTPFIGYAASALRLSKRPTNSSRRVTRPPVPAKPRVSRQQDENENPHNNEQAKHRVSTSPGDERGSSMPSKGDGSLRAPFESSTRPIRQPHQRRCPGSGCRATTASPCSRSHGGRSG